jgi:hypothetical protein
MDAPGGAERRGVDVMTQEEFERLYQALANLRAVLPEDACDCPDALAWRAFLETPAGRDLDRLATTLAVQKLRHLSHELAGANDWSRPSVSYAELKRRRAEPPAETPPANGPSTRSG